MIIKSHAAAIQTLSFPWSPKPQLVLCQSIWNTDQAPWCSTQGNTVGAAVEQSSANLEVNGLTPVIKDTEPDIVFDVLICVLLCLRQKRCLDSVETYLCRAL